MIDISPEQLKCLDVVINEIHEFNSSSNDEELEESVSSTESLGRKFSDKEQHYKDDLRAGAFQFVDAASENADELPLPYQVSLKNL